MTKETGGQAFPVENKWDAPYEHYNGMTLRDYFAAKAMQEHLHNAWVVARLGMKDSASKLMADVGTDAYKTADAMMEARK